MVLPLFYSNDLGSVKTGSTFLLSGSEGKHAAVVRRMRVGEGIQVSNGNGLRVIGVVSEVFASELSIKVSDVVEEALPELRISLVQALAKGDRDELAIQAATELGATAIVPWQANRSISRWEGSKAAKGRERWQTIVTEASKQSLRVWIPEVSEVLSSKQLAAELNTFDMTLVLDPTASIGLSELPSLTGSIALIVGPEGGIDPSELDLFELAGAKRVKLGAGILRTSTAGLAAISYLSGAAGLWKSGE